LIAYCGNTVDNASPSREAQRGGIRVDRKSGSKHAQRPMSAHARIDAIDFWRGFALLTIFADHMPYSVLAHVTHRNFGLSDAAEAFVFLSGMSAALAYGPQFHNGRIAAGLRTVGRRLLTLYGVHILLSFLALGIVMLVAILVDDEVMEDEDRLVLSNPGRGLLAILGLAHQIDFSNILPLYIVLLFAAPGLIMLARSDERLMLAASAAVYLLARACSLNIPTWPAEGGWFFNPFAWQLLFTIGLFVGLRLKAATHFKSAAPFNGGLFAMSLAVLLLSALIVTNGFGLVPGLWDGVRGNLDDDKRVLGIARLVHFLALAYVVHYSGLTQLLRRTAIFAPLCLIGRYSLPVFATGAILCTIGLAVMDEDWPSIPYSLIILAGGLAIHYLVASYLSTRSERRRNGIVIDRPASFLGAGTASGADRASPLSFLSSRRSAHTDGFSQYLDR
jgi:hypothetical protein